MYVFIRKKRRAKLDLKWGIGIYLGTLMSSNECYIGLPNGHVTRARGVARIQADQRWSATTVSNVSGTPARPHDGLDDSTLEGFVNPHLMLDEDELRHLEDEEPLVDEHLPLALRH